MIGSGVFLLPASLAGAGGPISLLGWVLTGAGAILLALVFANLARAFPREGHSLNRLTVGEATALVEASELGSGSMRPRVERWMQFAAKGGVAIIAALADVAAAVDGNAKTNIVPAGGPATVGAAC